MVKICPQQRSILDQGCSHPVCPVHRTDQELSDNHRSWADLIDRMQAGR